MGTGQNGENRFKPDKNRRAQSGAIRYRLSACSKGSNGLAEYQWTQTGQRNRIGKHIIKRTLKDFTALCLVSIHFANPVMCARGLSQRVSNSKACTLSYKHVMWYTSRNSILFLVC